MRVSSKRSGIGLNWVMGGFPEQRKHHPLHPEAREPRGVVIVTVFVASLGRTGSCIQPHPSGSARWALPSEGDWRGAWSLRQPLSRSCVYWQLLAAIKNETFPHKKCGPSALGLILQTSALFSFPRKSATFPFFS